MPDVAATPERAPIGRGSPREREVRTSTRARSISKESPPGGLVAAPDRLESRLAVSLFYPVWDTSGLLLLAFLAPLCAVLSVFSFGLRGFLNTGDDVMTMGALTLVFPMLCLLGLTFGYAGRFLADVLESSARGEIGHPRPPTWEPFEVLGSLVRWLGACGFGIAVGVGLAAAYNSASSTGGPPRAIDELVMAALLGLGAAFWPVPLVAVLLHADLRAANPITVFGAMLRAGRGTIAIGMLFGLAGAATLALADLLFQLPRIGIPATLLGILLFWALFWYEAMVLVRRLGLFYRRHSKEFGWFADRPHWGA